MGWQIEHGGETRSNRDEWIQLIDGSRYDFDGNHDLSGLTVYDVAKSLSQVNRFRGATRFPLNVAQHSVLVSRLAQEQALCIGGDPVLAGLYGLAHDAHEMVLSDIPSPVKRRFSRLPGFRDMLAVEEGRADRVLWPLFGLTWPMPVSIVDVVKAADLAALSTERRDAMANCRHAWQAGLPPPSNTFRVRREHPDYSASAFLARFEALAAAHIRRGR